MSGYHFKQCTLNDVESLVQFIDLYWQKNHILCKSRKLLNWQYFNSSENSYNFILAIADDNKEIHGILGFIPTQQFDESLVAKDLWLSIWKVRNDIKAVGMGFGLLSFLRSKLKPESICSIGLSREVLPIYRALKYEVGVLKQYLLINYDVLNYTILSCPPAHDLKSKNLPLAESLDMTELSPDNLSTLTHQSTFFTTTPEKSISYIINRYVRHPYYTYRFWLIHQADKKQALFVTRNIQVGHSEIIRLIDYYGPLEALGNITLHLNRLLIKENLEYLDFMHYASSSDHLLKTGFTNLNDQKSLIAPNYFEPFVKQNISIDFAYKSTSEKPFLIVKGDSDQDRPNLLEPL